MITAVLFVVAAGAGALARGEAGRRWNREGRLPLGTLLVNVSGSFLLGLLWGVAPPASTVLGTGALGAFTTFSSFSREVVALVEEGRRTTAAAYVAASCGFGLAAAAAGLALS